MDRRRMAWAVGLLAIGVLSRLLPHPPNFVPLGAIALAAGAVLPLRWAALAVPLGAMLVADLTLGLHRQMVSVYACFAVLVWLGARLGERPGPLRLSAAAWGGSTLFFGVTNLGVWAFDGLYPLTADGLLACYVAALPFYWNSLLADLLYAWLLFGLLALRAPARATRPRGSAGAPAAGGQDALQPAGPY